MKIREQKTCSMPEIHSPTSEIKSRFSSLDFDKRRAVDEKMVKKKATSGFFLLTILVSPKYAQISICRILFLAPNLNEPRGK